MYIISFKKMELQPILRLLTSLGLQSIACCYMVYWGGGIKAKDANKLNKLIKKAGKVIGSKLVTLEEVVEERLLAKVLAIRANTSHPLHDMIARQMSTLSFSNRLIQPRCLRERDRRSFLPSAIRLYNTSAFARPGNI